MTCNSWMVWGDGRKHPAATSTKSILGNRSAPSLSFSQAPLRPNSTVYYYRLIESCWQRHKGKEQDKACVKQELSVMVNLLTDDVRFHGLRNLATKKTFSSTVQVWKSQKTVDCHRLKTSEKRIYTTDIWLLIADIKFCLLHQLEAKTASSLFFQIERK